MIPGFQTRWRSCVAACGLVLCAAAVATAQTADDFNPNPDGEVRSLALQPDRKILVGGGFSTLDNREAGPVARQRIARLQPDGSVDLSFDPGASVQGVVEAIVVQPDGRVVVAGSLPSSGGFITRLNADGSPDAGFLNSAADGAVFAVARQSDGRILVGGAFTTLGGTARRGLGRLNANGSIDTAFDPGAGGSVEALLVQPDGRVLVGGTFTSLAGGTRHNIGRLDANGALDAAFDPGVGHPYPVVAALAMQPDGKILVGGRFQTLGGGGTGTTTRYNIGRLNLDGSVDATFTTPLEESGSGPVLSIVVLPTRKILASGVTVAVTDGGETGLDLARFNADGTLDPAFDAETSGTYHVLARQTDGRILVGGLFTTLGGNSRRNLGRIDLTQRTFTKLVGSTEAFSHQGVAVAISADGRTAIVGGPNAGAGAAWIWTRDGGGLWSEQAMLVGVGANGAAEQGTSVAISEDGNTAIVGGPDDADGLGAAWVWIRIDGKWIQQGAKLVGSGAVSAGETSVSQGISVALSADGNTAIVGGDGDNDGIGAAWVWTRSAGTWTQQGPKLGASDAAGSFPRQGSGVSLSGDGNTAIIGGRGDAAGVGAAWIWTRSGGTWTQQGSKLVGSGAAGSSNQGQSVSLSFDGNVAVVGGPGDNSQAGAAWVWSLANGVWAQQGPKLVGSGAVGSVGAQQGYAVALSGDGNTVVVGGWADDNFSGATWIWTRTANVWTQRGPKSVVTDGVGTSEDGTSVGITFDGGTVISGGEFDDNGVGAAWVSSTPVVANSFVTLVTPTSAQLNGTINSNGALTLTSFDYGTSDSYGTPVWVDPAVAPGLFPVAISTSIAGLECATLYHFRAVAARDATTYGPDVTFTTPACKPTISGVAPGNMQLAVEFTPGANGGFPITSYQYSLDGQPFVDANPPVTASPLVISGLTNGVPYQVRLRAVNALGLGEASDPVIGVPRTTPGAPTGVTITPGNGQLTVAFTPGATGGSPITNHEYSLNDAPFVSANPVVLASPLVITGLANGVPQMVRIRAVNAVGAGLASDPVFGRPSTTPDAPSITGIKTGNTQLAVVFTAGGDGGEAITNYRYSLDGGPWISRSPAALTSPLIITGLVNGTPYQLQLRAVNANGDGTPSEPTVAVPGLSDDETVDAFDPGANGDVLTLALQTDGKILVGGDFTMLGGGGTGTVPRSKIGRLNADGSVDETFNAGANIAPDSRITNVAVQADGRILVTSAAASPAGRRHIGRLETNGSRDETFDFAAANNRVLAIAVQPDGKVLVGGLFTVLGRLSAETGRNRIGRFNADGTVDSTFDPGANGEVTAIALQPDGRILVGGAFTAIGGGTGTVIRHHIARLNADGSVDMSFDPGAGGGANPIVRALRLQPDGRILVGGRFTTLGGGGTGTTTRHNVGRLNADGSLDASFDAGPAGVEVAGAPIQVETILLQSTGKILVGGLSVVAPYDDQFPRHLARLNANGSIDTDFEPRANGRVNALMAQDDGKVLVGGAFTLMGEQVRNRLARLRAPGVSTPIIPPVPFTDDPIVPGVTVLKAVHIVELRARINGVRQRFGLGAMTWTDPTLTGTLMRTVHIQELRDALLAAYDAAFVQGRSVTRPVFADNPLTPGASRIRALHIAQLRAAVVALEGL